MNNIERAEDHDASHTISVGAGLEPASPFRRQFSRLLAYHSPQPTAAVVPRNSPERNSLKHVFNGDERGQRAELEEIFSRKLSVLRRTRDEKGFRKNVVQ